MAHIRFRRAWVAQGNSLEDLAFRAAAGAWGSWIGLFLNVMCLVAQFYVALFPIGGTPNARRFFEAYLACPIVLALFIIWKIWKRTRYVRIMEIDLQSGRRELNLRELHEAEMAERAGWGPLQKYVLVTILLTSDSISGSAKFSFPLSLATILVRVVCESYATHV